MLSIVETKNPNIFIEPIKMDRNHCLHPNLEETISTIRSGSFVHINGPSNSGKTTIMLNLFTKKNKRGKKRQSFINCFHNIYLCSPSLHTIPGEPFKELSPDRVKKTLTIDFLDFIREDIQEQLDEYDKEIDNKEFNLLILDDVSTTINASKKLENVFNALVAERAHYNLTIVLLTQLLKMAPAKARDNSSHLFSKKPKGLADMELLFEHTGLGLSKKYMNDVFKHFFIEPHDFIYIDKSNPAKYKLYRNFNPVEIELIE